MTAYSSCEYFNQFFMNLFVFETKLPSRQSFFNRNLCSNNTVFNVSEKMVMPAKKPEVIRMQDKEFGNLSDILLLSQISCL